MKKKKRRRKKKERKNVLVRNSSNILHSKSVKFPPPDTRVVLEKGLKRLSELSSCIKKKERKKYTCILCLFIHPLQRIVMVKQ